MKPVLDDKHFLFLESFYGGSHRLFADGLIQELPGKYTLSTLPNTSWKQRLKRSAIYFYRLHRRDLSSFDAVITSSMMNTGDFKLLCGRNSPPIILYMHENQLTYPLSSKKRSDPYIRHIHLSSCIAADRIIFNSHYHKDAFISALSSSKFPENQFPDKESIELIISDISSKSTVLYPGISFPPHRSIKRRTEGPAVIVWNHRWEYDKQPEIFFRALDHLKEKKIPFRLIVLGEGTPRGIREFEKAKNKFSSEILHFGYAAEREAYYKLLYQGDILISTSIQENFGISAVEGMHAGLYPLFPDRLSYPELIPQQYHKEVLYSSFDDFIDKLTRLCRGTIRDSRAGDITGAISKKAKSFSWKRMAEQYSRELLKAVEHGRKE